MKPDRRRRLKRPGFIRRNADGIAIGVLAAAALLTSEAHKIVMEDLFGGGEMVMEHSFSGHDIYVIAPVPFAVLLRDRSQ